MNLPHALQIAQKAALAAGERILQGFAEPISFESKGDIADRVTQVDLDCQKIIQEKLNSEFPDIPFLGEEEFGVRSSEFESRSSNSELRWIVDPLDGTMNFTHRLPFCGVSIALEENGEIVLGVIHFPMLGWPASRSPDGARSAKAGEGWDFTAIKDGGAKKNGNPIKVSDCKNLEDAIIAEIYSDREARGKDVRYPPCAAFRKFGSAVTSLALLAEGAVDGVVLRCRKWDVAAAEVIIKEAGGKVSIKMDDPEDPRSALTCVAATPEVFEELCNFTSH